MSRSSYFLTKRSIVATISLLGLSQLLPIEYSTILRRVLESVETEASSSSTFVKHDENIYSLMKSAWSDDPSFMPEHASCKDPGIAGSDVHLYHCCPAESTKYLAANFTLNQLMNKWANKKVMMYGDSVSQQHGSSLAINARADRLLGAPKLGEYLQNRRLWNFEGHNTTLETTKLQGGIFPLEGVATKFRFPATTEVFEAAVREHDIMYVNFGVHLDPLTREEGKSMLQYTRRVLEADMAENPNKRHFYRATMPQHFIGSDGKGTAHFNAANVTTDGCVAPGIDTQEHWTTVLAKEVFRGSTVTVVDYSDFLEHRSDLHSGNLYDCTHWCWDYEMWRGIWYLMYTAF